MIVNKPSLVTKINEQLADNSTQEISPRDIRDNLLDIIDSVHLQIHARPKHSLGGLI